MRIGRTGPARPAAGAGRTEDTDKAGRAEGTAPAAEPRQAQDIATVAGISEAELTPNVRAALDRLLQEVHSLRQELERAQARIGHLEELADRDPLVPLINRRAFVRELSRSLAFAERYGGIGSVLYFDLNGMKEINDRLGHAAGDAALKRTAEVLSANVRASDAVGRLGGDEFGVLLLQADEAAATAKARELVAAVRARPLEVDGHTCPLDMAYGVYSFSGREQPDEALRAADQAMYEHKRGGAAPSAGGRDRSGGG